MNDDADQHEAAQPSKSASAFRTISEVASDLDLPQHVLRFWETKFPQVKPLKRGGGRRYYRPDDVQLLVRIRDLLYVDGYTIKGVQKLLRQSGSVRNFVNETEARLPLGEGFADGDLAVTPPGADTPAPGHAVPPPPATADAPDPSPAWRADVESAVGELTSIRALLLDAVR